MRNNIKNYLLRTSALLLLCAGITLGQTTSRLRVVHASPDAPAVDIFVDGSVAIDNLTYRDATDYLNLPSGQKIVQVFLAGTTTKVAEITASLSTGISYTVLAAGYAAADKRPAFQFIVLQDSLPLDTNWAYARVVHAAPAAPAVDVFIGAPFATLRGRTPALTNVPFGAASGYLPLTGGLGYMARVTPTGTRTVAIQSPRLFLPAGSAYTVVALDNTGGGTPFGFLVLQDR